VARAAVLAVTAIIVWLGAPDGALAMAVLPSWLGGDSARRQAKTGLRDAVRNADDDLNRAVANEASSRAVVRNVRSELENAPIQWAPALAAVLRGFGLTEDQIVGRLVRLLRAPAPMIRAQLTASADEAPGELPTELIRTPLTDGNFDNRVTDAVNDLHNRLSNALDLHRADARQLATVRAEHPRLIEQAITNAIDAGLTRPVIARVTGRHPVLLTAEPGWSARLVGRVAEPG
jgi:hypothetical protein